MKNKPLLLISIIAIIILTVAAFSVPEPQPVARIEDPAMKAINQEAYVAAIAVYSSEEEIPQAYYPLIGEERELITKIVGLETNDPKGAEWVAFTILNRIKSDKFPNTVSGVIFQPGQFATVDKLGTAMVKEAALAAVSKIFDEGKLPSEGCSLFFCSADYEEAFERENRTILGEQLGDIGGNIFYERKGQ